jgi:hypothetical protein
MQCALPRSQIPTQGGTLNPLDGTPVLDAFLNLQLFS